MRRKTTVYFDDADYAAIKAIREENGMSSDADAIRYAVRQIARKTGTKKKGGKDGQSV